MHTLQHSVILRRLVQVVSLILQLSVELVLIKNFKHTMFASVLIFDIRSRLFDAKSTCSRGLCWDNKCKKAFFRHSSICAHTTVVGHTTELDVRSYASTAIICGVVVSNQFQVRKQNLADVVKLRKPDDEVAGTAV